MSKLTPKQEAFCLAYIETGNASEAYRRSYDSQKMKPETVNRNAAALLKDNKIATRLSALQQRAEEKALLTLEEHMDELRALRELAKQNAQLSAAIKAEELRGRLRQFYVDKHELTGKDGDPIQINSADELISRISRLASRAKANGSTQRDH